jgi:hypothetical protein
MNSPAFSNAISSFGNSIMKNFITLLLLLAGFCHSPRCVAAEMLLELKDETAYGSGASRSDDLYYPGGVPEVGLYVGNPNKTLRNDRALFSFDTATLLLKAEKIKKAELIFWVDFYNSPEPKLELEVERLRTPRDTLSGQQLNDPEVDSVGTIEINGDDALNAPSGRVDAMEKRLDVTEVLKSDLQEGRFGMVFRFKIPLIEGRPVDQNSDGLAIAVPGDAAEKAKWPALLVTLEN